MYLRTTQRRRKDGSTVRYVQLAHNRRVNGITQAEVLVNLGREEDLDLPQVVIGLAVTREGIPVRVWVWPGNTNDMSVLGEVKDDLRGWRLRRVVTVLDRGFSSDENLRLRYLTRAGGHWIAGERMRDGSPDAQAALSRPGRYQQVRDNLRVKEVGVGDGDAATLHRLPQPRRSRPRQDPPRRHDRPSTGRACQDRRRSREGQQRERHRPLITALNARSEITSRSGATCARPRPAGC
ncbi:MAG: hypothetical protein LC777_08990 [Actinobacteria bacterium]|nr:hypothetical protein [Actinomycetota bacterium]